MVRRSGGTGDSASTGPRLVRSGQVVGTRPDDGTTRGRRLSANRRVGDANRLTLNIRAETAGSGGAAETGSDGPLETRF